MQQTGISATRGTARRFSLFVTVPAILVSVALGQNPTTAPTPVIGQARSQSDLAKSAEAKPSRGHECKSTGKSIIAIACDYVEAPLPAAEGENKPRIALNHLLLSFNTNRENYMRIELTFTNRGKIPFSDACIVYLAIDDASGHNFLRRVLPHVDFRRLRPGERLTFSERLLVGALLPGSYTVHLWIPDPNPSLKFNPDHNFLISSIGVPDEATGLNTLATFAIVR